MSQGTEMPPSAEEQARPTSTAVEQAAPRHRRRRRRSIMRLLGAGAGLGLLSRLNMQTAKANDGATVQAGQQVTASLPTRIFNLGDNTSYTPDSTNDAIQGYAKGTNRSGLFGRNNETDGIGVSGAAPSGTGVFGESSNGFGVGGRSTDGIGMYALSTNNYGAEGVTLKTGYAGLVGVGTVAGSAGFYALGISGATAGTFQGDVVINGSLTVSGTYPKSAAVTRRDGTKVRMYCQESPEPWFEDFGTATLTNGQASVPLDPAFGEVVNGNDYRVFLTEIGDCGGLFVSRKSPDHFEVRSRGGANITGTFDYRVVARRLDDVGKRLEKVTLPTMAPIDVNRLTSSPQ